MKILLILPLYETAARGVNEQQQQQHWRNILQNSIPLIIEDIL